MGYSDVLLRRMAELGMSKQQLAEASGIPYMTVSNILKRGAERAGVQNVFALCRALGLNPSGLVVLNGQQEMDSFRNSAEMTFGERLKFALDKIGMTARELSRKTEITEDAINKYIKNEASPAPNEYSIISWIMGISLAWLMGVFSTPMNDADESEILYGDSGNAFGILIDAYKKAPEPTQQNICKLLDISHVVPDAPSVPKMREMIVYDYPAAAGLPLYAESDFERVEFPENEIPVGADFGIHISGDSMEPTIEDGSIVWVHKQTDIHDGEVGIFTLADSAVCKRVRLNEHGRIKQLDSDNPAYDPITGSELEDLRVVGRVIL